MSILKKGTGATLVRAGVAASLALVATGALATSSQATGTTVTQQALTLSSVMGSDAGGNSITLKLATTASPKFSTTKPGIQFQSIASANATSASCSTNPLATTGYLTVANANVRYISSTLVSIVVPNLSAVTGATPGGFWLVCAYSAAATGSGGTVIPVTTPAATVVGRGNYLVAVAPTVALYNDPTPGVVPSSGAAIGGTTVTVTGTGFPTSVTTNTPLSVSVGGTAVPQGNITPVSSTSFTMVMPAHTAGAAALTVTTAGGSVTTATNEFTFVNGLSVTPTTVPGGSSVDVDITGSGFAALNFTTTTGANVNDANAHVYLVSGTYNATGFSGSVDKPNGEATECVNVAVISDTELICTIDAASRVNVAAHSYTYDLGVGASTYLQDGAYTVTIVGSGAATSPTYKTVLSSGATFTVANF